MQEILPGIHHWSAFHEGIGFDVSSYYVAPAGALIDPMLPPDGIDAVRALGTPAVVLLTNRHHYRHSGDFAEAFGCPVRCPASGLHEFENGPEVEGYAWDEEVAPGIVAREVGAICPDDGALEIGHSGRALAFADGLIHWGGGRVGFVRDNYLGDDPGEVKRGLRASLDRLAKRDADNLLFAHGEPLVGGGRAALRAFLAQG
jgi:hypothetical protein